MQKTSDVSLPYQILPSAPIAAWVEIETPRFMFHFNVRVGVVSAATQPVCVATYNVPAASICEESK